MVLGSLAVLDKDPLCTEEKKPKTHRGSLIFQSLLHVRMWGEKTNYNQTENFALGKIKFKRRDHTASK